MLYLVCRIKTDSFRSPLPVGLAIVLIVAVGAMRQPADSSIAISWKVINDWGQAIALRRNSHSTAPAWLVRYYGLDKRNETEKKLVAICWVYTQRCECGNEDKPTLWEIAKGLKKLFTARHYPSTVIEERCRYSNKSSEKAGWNDYVAAIKSNRPVIVTFCYDPATRPGLAQAKRRVSKSFSAVGIGYMNYGDQKLLICHDGITAQQSYPASVDKVSASDLGINTQGKPWGQAGTSLYKWEGSYSNLVMVFVGRPTK